MILKLLLDIQRIWLTRKYCWYLYNKNLDPTVTELLLLAEM